MKEVFIIIVAVAGFLAGMKYYHEFYPEVSGADSPVGTTTDESDN